MYRCALKHPYINIFSNETQKSEVRIGPPNEELGYRPLMFQGGLPVVPPVSRTVQDLGDE